MDIEYDYYDTALETLSEDSLLKRKEFSLEIEHLSPIFVVFAIAGLLTNGALIAILRKTNLRDAPNAYVISLTAANLLIALLVLPIAATAAAKPSYPFSEVVCKVTETLYEISLAASSFSLTALCTRCFLDGRKTTTETKRNLALIWALAVVVAAPTMYMAQVHQIIYDGNVPTYLCVTHESDFLRFWIPFRVVAYVAVLLATACYFYCDARQNRTADVPRSGQNCFARLTLVLVGVFVICVFPGYIVDICIIFHMYGEYTDFWHFLNLTGYCLTMAYSCVSPIAMYCASSAVRRLFDRHVFCWRTSNVQEPEPSDEMPLQNCAEG